MPPNFFFAELPRGPVGQIVCLEKEVVVLEKNRLLLWPQQGCCYSWGFPDNSCAFANNAVEKVCTYERAASLGWLRCRAANLHKSYRVRQLQIPCRPNAVRCLDRAGSEIGWAERICFLC